LYADYTASGRGLSFIENFIEENVLDNYANTHSKGTINGNQTTKFRNEARYNFKHFI
jgi:selenocysteine lyase/cysteine desulfurase